MWTVFKYLGQMCKHSQLKILSIWAIDVFNSISLFVTPLFIGKAIDGLSSRDYLWFYLLIIILFCNVSTEILYRICDTRLYEKIGVEFKEQYFEKAVEYGLSTSEIDANSELVDEFPDFLRVLISRAVTILSVFAILCYLYFEAGTWVLVATTVVTTVILLLQIQSQKGMQQDISRIRDETERRRDIIGKRNLLHYRKYLNRVKDFTISHSNQDAFSYAKSASLQLGLLIFSVWHLASSDSASAGMLFATITYIMDLNEMCLELPEIFSDYLRLKDGMVRINRALIQHLKPID